LVEVVIAASIITVFLVTLMATYSLYLRTAFSNLRKTQAVFLVEEGIEAVKLMRDDSWDARIVPLGTGSEHYLVFSGGKWATTTTNSFVNGIFWRHFTIEQR
jgi:type II secretory pathway pseudopilin PulG